MVIRGALVALGTNVFYLSWYYIDQFAALAMLVLLYLLTARELRIGRKLQTAIFSTPSRKDIAIACLLSVPVLMLTLGESAIQTILLSKIDVKFAYEWGGFHEKPYGAMPFLSFHVGFFILCSVIAPAIAEEFFFRATLVAALNEHRSYLRSVMISAAIFSLLHFTKCLYVSTFIFAMAASLLYSRSGSLFPSIAMHASYNFFAFIHSYYFDFHGLRSIDEIASIFNWLPELAMLIVSAAIVLKLVQNNLHVFSSPRMAMRQLP
jgi:membrane protease YdiL (CAAX protease family)